MEETVEEGYEQVPMTEDASRYMAEMKKEALGVLFPSPEEQDKRMDLITILRGKSPSMYNLYLAAVEWEVWLAIEERRKIRWDRLDPIKFIKSHAPSVQGRGRKDGVEIARASPTQHRHSVLDLMLRRG